MVITEVRIKLMEDHNENERLQAEGARDQASARMKQEGEHLKDAARDVTGS